MERAGWVSEKVFTDIITISQMTPGPLAVNTSTFVGLQIAGVPGAVAATVGCVLCGVALSLVPVSYTHLDVYKRQPSASTGRRLGTVTTLFLTVTAPSPVASLAARCV